MPARALRAFAKNSRSTSQMMPEAKVSTTSPSSNHFIMRAPRRRRTRWPPSLVVHREDREEGFLRDLDATDLLHAHLAFLLLFQKRLLARDVATIALAQHVLAQRLDRGARDDLRADRGLDGHVELLPRDQLLHLLGQVAAAPVGMAAVDDDRQRVHLVAVDQR